MRCMTRPDLARGLIAALALALAASAHAQTTVELVGPGDFSGAETQLTFDDLGLSNGSDIPVVQGVALEIAPGAPAKFIDDTFPRETGPQGTGTVNNFWALAVPYPDITVLMPGVVHRVSMEMRVNPGDDVSLTLRKDGVDMDTVTMPSRGADMLYFYGLENMDGFDEVLVDVVDNASGAFTLDNLTFESMGDPDLPDDPDPPAAAVFSCDGFKSHRSHWGHHSGFLWAKLLDEDGVEVGIQDLDSPPRAHVAFAPADGEDAHDVTEHVVWGDGSFFFTRRGNWAVFQKPWRMRRAGTYMTTMETGDPDEYVLDPTCVEYFEKKHRRHRRHRHDRR